MTWALAAAAAVSPILSSMLEGNRLDAEAIWSREFDRTIGSRQKMCHRLIWLLKRPLLARLAFESAIRLPAIAGGLVDAIHRPGPASIPARSVRGQVPI